MTPNYTQEECLIQIKGENTHMLHNKGSFPTGLTMESTTLARTLSTIRQKIKLSEILTTIKHKDNHSANLMDSCVRPHGQPPRETKHKTRTVQG